MEKCLIKRVRIRWCKVLGRNHLNNSFRSRRESLRKQGRMMLEIWIRTRLMLWRWLLRPRELKRGLMNQKGRIWILKRRRHLRKRSWWFSRLRRISQNLKISQFVSYSSTILTLSKMCTIKWAKILQTQRSWEHWQSSHLHSRTNSVK